MIESLIMFVTVCNSQVATNACHHLRSLLQGSVVVTASAS